MSDNSQPSQSSNVESGVGIKSKLDARLLTSLILHEGGYQQEQATPPTLDQLLKAQRALLQNEKLQADLPDLAERLNMLIERAHRRMTLAVSQGVTAEEAQKQYAINVSKDAEINAKLRVGFPSLASLADKIPSVSDDTAPSVFRPLKP